MKKVIFIFLISISNCFGQETLYVGPQSNNIDKTVYTAMQNIWYANEKISYLCFLPAINNQITPVIPLQKGEGESGKYVFEANLYYQIPIAMGRNQGSHFFQTSRATFDFGFNIRMAQEESSPLVPNNNIIGFTFEKKIYNSHTSGRANRANRENNIYSFENWYENNQSLHDVSAHISIHHYSNGQQGDFFVFDNSGQTDTRRNNYKSGDFSTNYINLGLTYSYLSEKRDLLSANLSYQFDGTFFDPLTFTDEQKNSYGQHRMKSFLQYRMLGKPRPTEEKHNAYDVQSNTQVPLTLNYFNEYIVRWESEYIMGSMSDYISDDKKYRFNQHLYLQFTRPNWRALGFVIHAYYGRDYSNIRYDMPIFALMGGLSFNFNKYNPPLSRAKRYM